MKYYKVVLILISVLLVSFTCGYFIGRKSRPSVRPAAISNDAKAQQVYTCSMHPQVRLPNPGKCPICEMPLIPADSAQSSDDGTPMLTLSEHAIAMAGIETSPVTYRDLNQELQAVGLIQYNETSLATITARVDGYAEKLFVNVTGLEINAGDHLIEIYSPDLLIAEQELLIALQDGVSGPLVESSKIKLRNWGLTSQQIDELASSRKIADRVTLYSPISGTVIEKKVIENGSFKTGDVLYQIANLDTVWVYLDIYEYDIAQVRYGQRVEIKAESYPGQVFVGMVSFVEPTLNEKSRTIKVPVHIENANHILKPGMFVSAVIKAAIGPDGSAAPTGIEGKFTCPMHPQVIADAVGLCPMCNMPLRQIPGSDTETHGQHGDAQTQMVRYACPMKCEGDKTYDEPGNCPVCNMKLKPLDVPSSPSAPNERKGLLAVPVSAVLDSGLRRIVFIEKGRGVFELREVTLGPRNDEYYMVIEGLTEGERVVTRGGFLIDSQFQITGHPSLYYPGGLHATMGHQHDGADKKPADMPTETPEPDEPKIPSSSGHNH
ncbi:MAG: efflux RND transporter periplasmic adaptor subunit [Planctomycetota bacterium]